MYEDVASPILREIETQRVFPRRVDKDTLFRAYVGQSKISYINFSAGRILRPVWGSILFNRVKSIIESF